MARGDGPSDPGGFLPNPNPLSEQYPPGSLGEYPNTGGSPPPPDPFAFHFPAAPDYGALYAQQAADAKAAQEAAARAAGEQERDQLYSDYLNAASTATDFINAEIMKEQSNAQLLGIDYGLTDEQKAMRISNYFATIWGEGDQARLEGLFGQWGEPSGFDGWTLERGDESAYGGSKELPGEASVGTSQGIRPRALTTSEDEETLSQATVLGA